MSPVFPVPFVLLTGGKGGVGKTTLSANLGVQLAELGLRPLLVDLDLGLANLNVLLRLSPRYTLEDFLSGERELADCLVAGPSGVRVLPAGSGTSAMDHLEPAARERLLEAMAGLAGEFDLVLGDAAAGIGEDLLAFAAAAQRVLVVTTPEPAALTDAYGVIKAIDHWSREEGLEVPTPEVVVNMADSSEEARRTADKLRQVCERFLCRSPRLVGWLPRSSDVQFSGRSQRPFVLSDPEGLAAKSSLRLAQFLAQGAGQTPSPAVPG